MLNKKMIEKFKNFENDIDDCDIFAFCTFDEFKNEMLSNFDDCDIDEYVNNAFDDLQNEYHCNNDNTIVLLYNCDDDEYLIINFENDNLIITQNIEIEYINNDLCKNALYEILQYMFTNEYYD